MINKLPQWVEVGGFSLSFIVGSINAIALVGLLKLKVLIEKSEIKL